MSQTISFPKPATQTWGSPPFTVNATASSGLPVVFTSESTDVCTVSGSTVTLVSAGGCWILATQPGDGAYGAASPVSQFFGVLQAPQTITFGPLSSRPYGSSPFTVSATASSGLPVSFYAYPSSVCTVSGSTVTLVAGGSCMIQAAQAGNNDYAAATIVNQTFSVTPLPQTISFGALPNQVFGSAPFAVSATATTGLPVSFSSLTPSVCTVSGSTVTLVSGGPCTIQANQAGNADYSAAPSVNQSFTVTPESQTINFGVPPGQTVGAVFNLSASASSGLTVSFTSLSMGICTVSGTTVNLLSAGTCTIQATQAGNASWAPAAPVNQSFTVTAVITINSFNTSSGTTFVGLTVALDGWPNGGSTCTTPCQIADGRAHSVQMPSPEAAPPGTPNAQAAFSSWSDGASNANPHTIQPGTTVTVNYTTQYQLTTGAPTTGGIVVLATTPNSYGVVSPSGTYAADGWYNAGTSLWLTGLPTTAGWGFIDLSNEYRQQEVVMNQQTTVTANFAPAIVAQPAFSPIVVPAGGSTTVRFTVPNGGSGQSQSALHGGAVPNIRQLIGAKGKRQHPRDDPYENTGCYSNGDALGASIIQAIQYDSYAAFWATFSADSQVPTGGAFDVTCSCQYYGCSIDLGPNYGGPSADSVVVTGVSPAPPWQAGSTVNFAITGTGFGTSPTLNITWADGTSYSTSCSSSSCDGEIDGTVTVPSDAVGQAMATVSATYSGLGLLGGSSGQVGSDPYAIQITSTAVTLNATWNGTAISQGSTVWITPAPSLSIVASLVPNAGGSLPSGANITWSFQSTYTGPDGVAYTSNQIASQPANNSWNVNQALGAQGQPGGSALLSASYQGNSYTLTFNILGQNPSASAVRSALGTSPWFLAQIAQQESPGYQQFTGSGYPTWGAPSGYGIMQLDPPRSVSDMWVWTTNVTDGVNYNASNQNAASIAWNQQLNAWQLYNATNPPVAMQPSISTGNCVFSYTPSGGQHPFSDGIWIKFYNTGSAGNPYLAFNPATGQWNVQDGQSYVQGVCSKTP